MNRKHKVQIPIVSHASNKTSEMVQMTECDFFNGTVGSLISNHKIQFKRYSNGDCATYQDLNTIFDNYQIFMDEVDNSSYVP